jgi:hypothetical protein
MVIGSGLDLAINFTALLLLLLSMNRKKKPPAKAEG